MRALSIIGIVMSVIGLITCIFIMTAAKCNCFCDDSLYNSNSVPSDAIGGSLFNMLIFIFFLVMSIVGTSKSYSARPNLAQHIPPFQANPYPNYQQPGSPSYSSQNPYVKNTQQQNPYQQNPYQQNPYQNPPQQNPYQHPSQQNPFQHPYQNPKAPETPDQDIPPAPPTNPWAPK
ncbi:MAG: hypothetical protein ABIQ40_10195 [Bacteroidia bacterium]